jgi:hypothetical protein
MFGCAQDVLWEVLRWAIFMTRAGESKSDGENCLPVTKNSWSGMYGMDPNFPLFILQRGAFLIGKTLL